MRRQTSLAGCGHGRHDWGHLAQQEQLGRRQPTEDRALHGLSGCGAIGIGSTNGVTD